jgi:hypothetical protein
MISLICKNHVFKKTPKFAIFYFVDLGGSGASPKFVKKNLGAWGIF